MLSKGGKISYHCPYCTSPDIEKVYIPPVMAALIRSPEPFTVKEWEEGVPMDCNHGECSNCDRWFFWYTRIKQPLKNI